MGNSDSLADPVNFRFLISTGCPNFLRTSARVSRAVFIWLPLRVTLVTPRVHLSVMTIIVRTDVSAFHLRVWCRQLYLAFSRLLVGSLSLQPAGLLDSLSEPLSGNLVFRITLYTSLKLCGRTVEFPPSDFNRQVICFTRHTPKKCN